MKEDVYVLASDSMEGRMSGSEGERRASEYLIRRFSEAGMKPMGTDGSWLQSFPERERHEAAGSELVIAGKEYTLHRDFGLVGVSSSGEASGEIADIGSGLFLPGYDVDDYAGKEVGGKIVLMDLYVPGKWIRNDSTRAPVGPAARMKMAFARGASGVICHDPNSRWGLRLGDAGVSDTVAGPVIYVTRDIVKEIRQQSHPVAVMKTRFAVETAHCHNVVGYIDHHAPYTIILGAHYDHTGVGKHTDLIKNGADDNASGTALITELGRYYAARTDVASNFLIIALSGEEEGLHGSYYFADHPTVSLDSVNFMFNFDMVGRLGCRQNRVDAVCTGTSPAWNKILRDAGERSFRIRRIPGAPEFSDHYPFYRQGLPIAYLTTGMHYDYHSSRDDAEKINYTGMAEVARYARGIIAESLRAGKIPYKKVSRFTNFRSMLYYAGEQLDYVLTVGIREIE